MCCLLFVCGTELIISPRQLSTLHSMHSISSTQQLPGCLFSVPVKLRGVPFHNKFVHGANTVYVSRMKHRWSTYRRLQKWKVSTSSQYILLQARPWRCLLSLLGATSWPPAPDLAPAPPPHRHPAAATCQPRWGHPMELCNFDTNVQNQSLYMVSPQCLSTKPINLFFYEDLAGPCLYSIGAKKII